MYNYPNNNQYNYGGYPNPNLNPKKKKKGRSKSPRNDYQVPSYNQTPGYSNQQYYQGYPNYQQPGYNYTPGYPNYQQPNYPSYQQPGYNYQGYNYNQPHNYQVPQQPTPTTDKNDLDAISRNINANKTPGMGGYTYNVNANQKTPGVPGKPGFFNQGNDMPMRNFSFGQGPVPGQNPGDTLFLL
jgi:hypothetical protein